MIRILSGCLVAGLLLASLPIAAQVSPEEFETTVRYLSNDELEGRRTGTRGNLLAAGFIAGAFAEAGLQPVDGAWLHDFSYVRGARPGPELSLVMTYNQEAPTGGDERPGFQRTLVPGTDFSILGYSSEGEYSGEVVFAGYGISAPDENYDDYAGIDVDGKVVVVFRHSPDVDNPHGPLGAYAGFVQKIMTARERGAAAILMVDMREDAGLIPLFFDRRASNAGIGVGTLHRKETLSLRSHDGRSLVEMKEEIDQSGRPSSFPLIGWSARLNADIMLDEVSVPNVLGMLPGNDPEVGHEIVVVGGHFDHLGHGGSGSLDDSDEPAIHNGADDNSSGTSTVVALARRWAERGGNRRTLMFMAFNGEEEGLLGSAALVEEARFDVKNVVSMINLDMVGRMDDREIVVQGYGTSSAWESVLEVANTEDLMIKTVPDGFGPSDHSSFYAKEIPVLFFFTGLHDNYHRPSDDWQTLNYNGISSVFGLVDRVLARIDANPTAPDYVNVPRKARASGVRLKVVLGVIPDYGWGGDGLRIVSVSSEGPAAKAGIEGGDVITALDGTAVGNIEEYTVVLSKIAPGTEIDVTYVRGDEERSVRLIPQSR